MTVENMPTTREAVGIFDNIDALQSSIQELQSAGFDRSYISVLGSEAALKGIFGTLSTNTKTLAEDPNTPRAVNITQEEVSIAQGALVTGGIMVGVAAAIIASGGLVALSGALAGIVGGTAAGGILAKLLGDKYTEFFDNEILRGGLLVWVKTDNAEKEKSACVILKKHNARNVHVHDVASPALVDSDQQS